MKKKPDLRTGRRLGRLVAAMLLFTVGGLLLRGVGGTVAYLSDTENSAGNTFAAGALDFELQVENATSSICALPDEPLKKTIRIQNFGNPFKYSASSTAFTGDLCDYVNLDASLAGEFKYSGPVKSFDYGLLVFSSGEDWTFDLSVAADAPPELDGQTCVFQIDFEGSQTRHDLPFPEGFSDIETIGGDILAPYCQKYQSRTIGYWKTHPEAYEPLLPQFLGGPAGDEIIDSRAKVNAIFNAKDSVMRNKLKKQLLAMKFNIASFYIGNYVPAGSSDDLDAIVAAADELLRREPPPDDRVLEEMKNLLNGVNNLHEFRQCNCESLIGKIVINEFLPNPEGSDSDPKPGGEWVELYNKSDGPIDVDGWALYDASDEHELVISPSNTVDGATIVPADGFLVVYRDGDADFTLNNAGGDSVRLYDGRIISEASLIDAYTYATDAPEGKSFARIPDGSDNWVDPIPTPGEKNSADNPDFVFGPATPEEGEEGYLAPPQSVNALSEPVATATDESAPQVTAETTIVEVSSDVAETSVNNTETTTSAAEEPDVILIEPAAAEGTVEVIIIDSESAPAPEAVSESPTLNDGASSAQVEPMAAPESPMNREEPIDEALAGQTTATNPPEIILPEAPSVAESGSGE